MKTVRKTLILAACAIMLVCATIAGTLAYLTATDSVKNTFTVGNVNITLDEAKVDANGKEIVGDEAERVKANSYKLLPGNEYDKDPVIRVSDTSEDCYVFVEVTNNISSVEATGEASIVAQMTDKGWVNIGGTSVYYKQQAASGGDEVEVFDTFTVSDSATNEQLKAIDGKTIEVKAYAVQKEGFDSAVDAWNATFGAEAQG